MSELALKLITEAKEKRLTTLDLGNCGLTEIPEELFELVWLEELSFSNRYVEWDEKVESKDRKNKNQFSKLPQGFAKLRQLNKLILSGDDGFDGSNIGKISDVSPLTSLTKLTQLDLSYNQISDISPLINIIKKGIEVRLDIRIWQDGIFVAWNLLQTPPPEVIAQGNQAILTYFQDLKQQGTGKLNEAKLIIVGEPEAGKTTLMECLLNPDYSLSDDTQSTLGIEVREGWQFPHPNTEYANTLFTANIWDFGGQQIQYMTHQFFLTPSAVYVLLSANDRKEPTNFPYWFKTIHLLGEEQGRYSPVLVVLNEKDQQFINKFNFDLAFYQKRYPELQISVCEVDLSQRDSRFQVLRETVQKQLSQLPHVTDDRPARWNAIRDDLRVLAEEKDYIHFADYAAICQQHGVDNEASQKVLSGYLHRLGSLLHFVDDPSLQGFIILKPQWAVDAVYSVLVDNEIARDDGYFSQAKLYTIWQHYSVNERVNLLNLMKQENFEICYELKNNDKDKHYIAPQLLSAKQPFYQWDDSECLKFRFQYKFMPEGIITRLIVRMHHLIAQHDGCGLSWRKGVLLEQNGCRAQIREDENRDGLKMIDIAVTGEVNQRKYLLHSIREEIQQIHRKWFRNIQAEQMIPCVCAYCVNPEHKQTKYFEFSVLERARERGKATVECDKEFMDVPVMALLEGVFKEEEIQWQSHQFGADMGGGTPAVHIHNHLTQNAGQHVEQLAVPVTPTPEPEPVTEENVVWWKEAWFSAVIATILTALVAFGLLVNWVEILSASASALIATGIGSVVGYVIYKLRTYNPYRTIGLVAFSFVLLNNVSFLSGKLNSTINFLGQQATLSLAWGDPLNVFVSLALLAYSGFALYLSKQQESRSVFS